MDLGQGLLFFSGQGFHGFMDWDFKCLVRGGIMVMFIRGFLDVTGNCFGNSSKKHVETHVVGYHVYLADQPHLRMVPALSLGLCFREHFAYGHWMQVIQTLHGQLQDCMQIPLY